MKSRFRESECTPDRPLEITNRGINSERLARYIEQLEL